MATTESIRAAGPRVSQPDSAGNDHFDILAERAVGDLPSRNSFRDEQQRPKGRSERHTTDCAERRQNDSISGPSSAAQSRTDYEARREVDRPSRPSLTHTIAAVVTTSDASIPEHAERQTQINKSKSREASDDPLSSDVKKNRSPNKGHSQNTRRQGVSKSKRKVPPNMQAQWRIGAAPSVASTLSREESQMTRVLSQATAFHRSMSDVFWGPSIRHNAFIYDLDNRIEVFRDSSVAAACLVAAGKSNSAQRILDKVLPSMDDLFKHPPPALYLILAELALGLVKTPNAALRVQITQYLSGRALQILGSDHPIATLLMLQLPQNRKEVLAERLWKAVLPILSQTFGVGHYQSSTQVFCHARNSASCGRLEEAIESIEGLIDGWSRLYGGNSLIVCYAKIELANILVAARSDIKAELIVSDALRTSEVIYAAGLRNEDCSATEMRHRESSIAFSKVAGLRTLGRLHRIRGNLGAATHYYYQAVSIGSPLLGKDNAAVELAQSDLDSARHLELQQSLDQFNLRDLSNLANIIASPIC